MPKGRPPTPTQRLRLTNPRAAERRAKSEPSTAAGRPKLPHGFAKGTEQRRVWDQVCEILAEMGILSRADPFTLERYCMLFVNWRSAQKTITADGQTVEYDDGRIVARPEVRIVMQMHKALLDVEREFGLTPCARARISVERVKPAPEPTANLGFTAG